MTPERIEELRKVVDELHVRAPSNDDVDGLQEALRFAKAAIPSGQVKEDVDLLVGALEHINPKAGLLGFDHDAVDAALTHLAAQAQSAETYRKERDEWREKWEGATQNEAKALEQARLGWERAAEKDRAYGDMIAQRDAALARCAELSAAGQVLSEHVDKAPECAGEPDCGWHNGGPCEACKRATGWTLRDEFAMVAMHTVTVACKAELDDGRLSFRNIATRSYGIADEMLKAREAK